MKFGVPIVRIEAILAHSLAVSTIEDAVEILLVFILENAFHTAATFSGVQISAVLQLCHCHIQGNTLFRVA